MNWFKRAINFVVNKAAEGVGETEDVIHHPLYPIQHYSSVVDEGILVRGSWPEKKFLKRLNELGYKAIINLCSERKQDVDVLKAGLTPVNIPIEDNDCPKFFQVVAFFACLRNQKTAYIHCEQGKGRTGCMVAAYRVLIQDWKEVDALKEAEKFGLSLPSQKEWILNLRRLVIDGKENEQEQKAAIE